jgi:hypothetical protein
VVRARDRLVGDLLELSSVAAEELHLDLRTVEAAGSQLAQEPQPKGHAVS